MFVLRICVAECVFTGVFYGLDDGELALCRQPVLILWNPPQLQHVGNKPFSSNLQTVQQSMGNYLGQSMGQPFYFSPLSTSPAVLSVSFLPAALLPSLSSSLLSHFLLSLCFFHPLLHSTPSPTFTCVPSSSLGSAAPTLKCDSSAAPEPLTKSRLHPRNI